MKHLVTRWSVALAALSFAACGKTDWSDGVPGDEQVSLNLKGSGNGALVDDTTQRAQLYDLTYAMTRGVNGLVVGLLAVTRLIVNQEPTERPDDNHAVWGPSQPSGLERLQFKATGERVGEDEFNFALLARPKGSTSEDDYGEIYSINYLRAGDHLGHGTITIDRDQHRLIDPMDGSICETGKAVVTFANDGADGNKAVDIDFSQLDRSNCPNDNSQMGLYHYAEAADGHGDFSFSAKANMHDPAENKPGLETLTIRARWTAQGSGRCDLIAESAEIAADLTACGAPCGGATRVVASQCWDTSFISRFEDTDPPALRDMLLPGKDANGAPNPIGDVAACGEFESVGVN